MKDTGLIPRRFALHREIMALHDKVRKLSNIYDFAPLKDAFVTPISFGKHKMSPNLIAPALIDGSSASNTS